MAGSTRADDRHAGLEARADENTDTSWAATSVACTATTHQHQQPDETLHNFRRQDRWSIFSRDITACVDVNGEAAKLTADMCAREGTASVPVVAGVRDDIFAVNVRSHFLIAPAAMPLLDDGGSFVFIGSAAGLKAGTRFPAYDSSKAALFGLTRHVALEGAPRSIRANHVIRGAVG